MSMMMPSDTEWVRELALELAALVRVHAPERAVHLHADHDSYVASVGAGEAVAAAASTTLSTGMMGSDSGGGSGTVTVRTKNGINEESKGMTTIDSAQRRSSPMSSRASTGTSRTLLANLRPSSGRIRPVAAVPTIPPPDPTFVPLSASAARQASNAAASASSSLPALVQAVTQSPASPSSTGTVSLADMRDHDDNEHPATAPTPSSSNLITALPSVRTIDDARMLASDAVQALTRVLDDYAALSKSIPSSSCTHPPITHAAASPSSPLKQSRGEQSMGVATPAPPQSRPRTASNRHAKSTNSNNLATRPAFVVSTSVPEKPLALGVIASLNSSSAFSSSTSSSSSSSSSSHEGYRARIAREAEARRAAKTAAEQLARERATGEAEEAEREKTRRAKMDAQRREAARQALAAQKKAAEDAARAKAEAEAAAAKAARKAEREQLAKRKAEREETECKKAEEAKAAAAEAQAQAAAAEAAKRKKKLATKSSIAKRSEEGSSAASTKSSTPTTSAPTSPHHATRTPALQSTAAATPATVQAAATPSHPTPTSATPDKKARALPAPKRPPIPTMAVVEYGTQTDFVPEWGKMPTVLQSKVGRMSDEEREEEEREARELAALSLVDQVAKLKLDQRYNRLRIRALDQESAASLARINELKNELAKSATIIKEQKAELEEWRLEGKKMVSTGLPDGRGNQELTKAKDDSETTSTSSPTCSDFVLDLTLTTLSLSPPPLSSPPSPAMLAWLRSLVSHVQSLDRRRKEAEKKVVDIMEKGRLAEIQTLEMYKENERLRTQLEIMQKKQRMLG